MVLGRFLWTLLVWGFPRRTHQKPEICYIHGFSWLQWKGTDWTQKSENTHGVSPEEPGYEIHLCSLHGAAWSQLHSAGHNVGQFAQSLVNQGSSLEPPEFLLGVRFYWGEARNNHMTEISYSVFRLCSQMSNICTGVSNPRPTGHMQPRIAMNAAQHKIVNLLKTLLSFITVSLLRYVHFLY